MSNSEEYYIYQQLEPESVLITGNAKRWFPLEPKGMFEKMRGLDELRLKLGEEEYVRQCEIHREWEKLRYEETKEDAE